MQQNRLELIPESLIEESYQCNTIEITHSEITFSSYSDNIVEEQSKEKYSKYQAHQYSGEDINKNFFFHLVPHLIKGVYVPLELLENWKI